MKINYEKSGVYVLGIEEIEKNRIAELLNCKVGELPITYLGLPVSDCKLSKAQLNFVAVKMAKRLGAWQCDYLSSGGKSISIQSCLSSIPLYANGCVLCTSSMKKSKSGRQTRFWHDFWVGINPLKIEFWQLFQIFSDPDIEVGKVWRENQWQISFRMTGRTAHG